MQTLRSWRALFGREYLEHRMPFLYVPIGIAVLLFGAALSAIGFNRLTLFSDLPILSALKLFELGYLLLMALWFFYMGVTLFFYFGDAFNADRRNNAMFFWKSMPVSDLKIMASKFLAGLVVFPLLIFGVAAATGVLLYLLMNIAVFMSAGLAAPDLGAALGSYIQITGFAALNFALALLWYAPFLAWVGGLSTVFGRWSLPLAFVIPGLISVVENIVLFGTGPRGGYVWAYLSRRWQFGLDDIDRTRMATMPFDAGYLAQRLIAGIDWPGLVVGLVFAAIVIWLASQYRRRRIT